MNVDLSESSVVQYFEGTEKHRCGYCKNESSISNGMWAENLTVNDYQDLIDRGWRRSGKYCYKPIMEKTCCPLYTIKCDCLNFSLSKSQKKIIKKFNKFLQDGELNIKDNSSDSHNIEEPENCTFASREIPKINIDLNISENIFTTQMEASTFKECEKIEEEIKEKHEKMSEETEKICDTKLNESSQIKMNLKSASKEGIGADPSKPPCKKAKLLRRERKKEKSLKKGIEFNKTQTTTAPKSIEEFLEEVVSDDNKNQLRISLISTSKSNSNWKEVEDIEFQLYKKYQIIIHEDPPSKLTMNGFSRFLVKSPLKTCLNQMSSTNIHFDLSAELFKKYQMIIHNDPPHECDEEQFYNFLVETPLQPQSFPEGVEGVGYGSFHQQYWLNNKLIAVGVIDILPRCISSVYFFYDPDYKSLTLGTYGSMREVQLTRQLQKSLPDLKNYYMGFYIHSCPKMRYKGKLAPSFLLCPETYSWCPIETCIPLLETNKYSRLNKDIDALDHNIPSEENILKTKIVYKYRLMRFMEYKILFDEDEKYREIGHLVGKTCLNNLIFWEQ